MGENFLEDCVSIKREFFEEEGRKKRGLKYSSLKMRGIQYFYQIIEEKMKRRDAEEKVREQMEGKWEGIFMWKRSKRGES